VDASDCFNVRDDQHIRNRLEQNSNRLMRKMTKQLDISKDLARNITGKEAQALSMQNSNRPSSYRQIKRRLSLEMPSIEEVVQEERIFVLGALFG
jgi:hypothetical protein